MTFSNAPGRVNVFDEYPFRVIMDYAHNAPALTELKEFILRVKVRGRRIGVVGSPGDRRDVDIHDFAKLAAETFDLLIIREDLDPRGRAPGEVANMIRDVALQYGKTAEQITVIEDEFASIQHALDFARRDDLLVVLADKVIEAWKLITKYRQPDVYRRWLRDQGQEIGGGMLVQLAELSLLAPQQIALHRAFPPQNYLRQREGSPLTRAVGRSAELRTFDQNRRQVRESGFGGPEEGRVTAQHVG
jgi:hypothetical protein